MVGRRESQKHMKVVSLYQRRQSVCSGRPRTCVLDGEGPVKMVDSVGQRNMICCPSETGGVASGTQQTMGPLGFAEAGTLGAMEARAVTE